MYCVKIFVTTYSRMLLGVEPACCHPGELPIKPYIHPSHTVSKLSEKADFKKYIHGDVQNTELSFVSVNISSDCKISRLASNFRVKTPGNCSHGLDTHLMSLLKLIKTNTSKFQLIRMHITHNANLSDLVYFCTVHTV